MELSVPPLRLKCSDSGDTFNLDVICDLGPEMAKICTQSWVKMSDKGSDWSESVFLVITLVGALPETWSGLLCFDKWAKRNPKAPKKAVGRNKRCYQVYDPRKWCFPPYGSRVDGGGFQCPPEPAVRAARA